jgi:hypothetical protein
MVNDEEAPTGRPAGAIGWAGLANCFYWIDRKNGFGGYWATRPRSVAIWILRQQPTRSIGRARRRRAPGGPAVNGLAPTSHIRAYRSAEVERKPGQRGPGLHLLHSPQAFVFPEQRPQGTAGYGLAITAKVFFVHRISGGLCGFRLDHHFRP